MFLGAAEQSGPFSSGFDCVLARKLDTALRKDDR